MNNELIKRLGTATGGTEFPEVFKQYQETYTKQVLIECNKVFMHSNEKAEKYLAIDLLYDIQKHFDIDLTTK
jgi:hypothetical protein